MAMRAGGQWVARAGLLIWVLTGVAGLLDLYVIVVEGTRSGGFLVDRFFLPLICGLLAAGLLAVAISGILLRGQELVAVDIVWVTALHQTQIAEVDDLVGLAIRTRDDQHVQPYVCQGGVLQQRDRRRIVAAETIRAWLDDADDGGAPAPPVEPTHRRPRWPVLIGVPVWAIGTGLFTVALHALLH